ncbi:DNA-binding response regulator [Paenibacillus sp. 598K]|uniref:response regulator n=1 Tax=Paenibacillus sp. 598K TaxID=1117987 RepID=UPI000FF92877|nr:response regulator [Paenibacillus sp. 598K]GBF77719.1 DNA-binding response regulator [Paenibacillus sp. 598K]
MDRHNAKGMLLVLQILVVDDELRQRRILSNLIRDYNHDYNVLEASNGEEALALCAERALDLVFSDIRMPKLDGLGMIEAICERHPDAKIVIVSGYSDFEYARRALHLRVHKYILKPIQREGIEDTLRELEAEISRERQARLETESMAEQVSRLRPLYSDYLVNKWLSGECTSPELTEVRALLHAPGQGCAIIIRLSRPDAASTETNAEAWNAIKWEARTGLTGLLSSFGHNVAYFSHQDTNAVASLLRFTPDGERDEARLPQQLDRLATELARTCGIMVTVGIGRLHPDLYRDVQDAILSAEAALRSRFFDEAPNVFSYDEAMPLHAEELQGPLPMHEAWMPLVYGQQPLSPAAVSQALERLLGEHRPDPRALLDYVRSQLLQLIQGARNIIPGDAADQLARSVELQLDPSRIQVLSELRNHLLATLEALAALIQSQRDNKNHIVMERCLQYIHGHLGEEISFEELSKRFYFHPSYFSTLFKKHTGTPFTEYLTRLRIETAYSILRNTDKKVYEVAHEVGYRDVKYFTKVFKKHYGLTPEEGRKFKDRGEPTHGH